MIKKFLNRYVQNPPKHRDIMLNRPKAFKSAKTSAINIKVHIVITKLICTWPASIMQIRVHDSVQESGFLCFHIYFIGFMQLNGGKNVYVLLIKEIVRKNLIFYLLNFFSCRLTAVPMY